MSQIDPSTGEERQLPQGLCASVGILTFRNTTLDLGIIPKYSYVSNVRIHVVEAFSSGNIKVGHSTDDDAYSASITGAGTGVLSNTLGAGVGYDSTARQAQATVSGTPTSGKAIIIIEYYRVPKIN